MTALTQDEATVQPRARPGLSRLFYYILVAVLAGQVLIGMVWIAKNFGHIPAYGDTPEYLQLSKTLALDQFRTILYPLFLRLTLRMAGVISVPYQVIVYLLQSAVSFFSILYLLATIDPRPARTQPATSPWLRWLTTVGLSLFVFTTPLIAHYNMSVLSDSFALSFTLLFVGGIAAIFSNRGSIYADAAVVALGAFLVSITRPERLVICLLFALTWLTIVIVKRHLVDGKHSLDRRVLVLLVAATIGLGGAQALNAWTQTAAPARVQPSLASNVFVRVTWPRMTKVYRYLPADIKKFVSYQDAVTIDSDPAGPKVVVAKILLHDEGRQTTLNRIVLITLERFGPEVAWYVTADFIQNLGGPFTLAGDALIHNTRTRWDVTRMSEAHPLLTRIYLTYAAAALGVLVLFCGYACLKRPKTIKKLAVPLTLFVVFNVVMALFFAVFAEPITNVRYLTPVYTLVYAALALVSWAATSESCQEAC
jgi:hypothetical protein